jgi:hypothetical protein
MNRVPVGTIVKYANMPVKVMYECNMKGFADIGRRAYMCMYLNKEFEETGQRFSIPAEAIEKAEVFGGGVQVLFGSGVKVVNQ